MCLYLDAFKFADFINNAKKEQMNVLYAIKYVQHAFKSQV